eukprot:gene25536-biopygen10516
MQKGRRGHAAEREPDDLGATTTATTTTTATAAATTMATRTATIARVGIYCNWLELSSFLPFCHATTVEGQGGKFGPFAEEPVLDRSLWMERLAWAGQDVLEVTTTRIGSTFPVHSLDSGVDALDESNATLWVALDEGGVGRAGRERGAVGRERAGCCRTLDLASCRTWIDYLGSTLSLHSLDLGIDARDESYTTLWVALDQSDVGRAGQDHGAGPTRRTSPKATLWIALDQGGVGLNKNAALWVAKDQGLWHIASQRTLGQQPCQHVFFPAPLRTALCYRTAALGLCSVSLLTFTCGVGPGHKASTAPPCGC